MKASLQRTFIKKMNDILDAKIPLLITGVIAGILVDIFFIPGSSDVRIFSILILYWLASKVHNLNSQSTLYLVLGLLALTFIQYLASGPSEETEKAAVWFVLFLLIGIIAKWRE
jgi:hypothetical protein